MSDTIRKMKDVESASISGRFECSGSLGVIFLHFKVKMSVTIEFTGLLSGMYKGFCSQT